MSANSSEDLQRIYAARFQERVEYRRRVWRVLIDCFFQQFLSANMRVLDLGCGYGEFINQIGCDKRHAMDLNPEAEQYLSDSVMFHRQDCSQPWQVPENSLDLIFTSNFFEHLPSKEALGRTLDQAYRALAPGGHMIALGPNVRYLPGTYWDFWDHHVPLTHLSLREALETRGFNTVKCIDRFLPYTMVGGPEYPMTFLRAYLKFSLLWRLAGKQFLVVARKGLAQEPSNRACPSGEDRG